MPPQAPPATPKPHARARLAFAADDLADPLELLRHPLVGGDDLVEGVGDLALQADLVARHANREIAGARELQRREQVAQVVWVGVASRDVWCPGVDRRRALCPHVRASPWCRYFAPNAFSFAGTKSAYRHCPRDRVS